MPTPLRLRPVAAAMSLLLAGLSVGCKNAERTKAAQAEVTTGVPSQPVDVLGQEAEPLRSQFDRDDGRVRLVLILSPT